MKKDLLTPGTKNMCRKKIVRTKKKEATNSKKNKIFVTSTYKGFAICPPYKHHKTKWITIFLEAPIKVMFLANPERKGHEHHKP